MTILTRFMAALLLGLAVQAPAQSPEFLKSSAEPGRFGGRLVVGLRAEAKTLNPVTALDSTSREVIRRMHADLVHINRNTQRTEPALAKSWKATPDGRKYTLELRRGLKFSDGHPFDADDVVFSFQVYLDEKLHSPQRDLLVVGGAPLIVRKRGPYTVEFEFAQPYAAGDRLFDVVAMLPKHLLEPVYREGKIAQVWTLATPPQQIAGLGPFRLKQYVPGQSVTLERNPYYWKTDTAGRPLPYVDELTFITVPNDDAQVLRFQNGETDVMSRISADNFVALGKQQARRYQLVDAGPGLEYNFLLLNLNDDTAGRLPQVVRKQKWFREVKFRQAISAAIDRDSIVRLVYHGRGAPLWQHVTPGNKMWFDATLPHLPRDTARARTLLQSAGFKWNSDGALLDPAGEKVEFTIAAPSSNAQRSQMATIIQQDLKDIGMQVQVVALEFRSLVERVTGNHDYDAAIMGIGAGDVDPTAEMNVLLSSGSTHLWNLGQKQPATPWEAEIDRLMQQQATTMNYQQRKRLYDRVQKIVADQLPIICLASPNILTGAKSSLGNFRPAIMDHYTLHNVDELFWRK
jgi:peptide/nickel transport system substrate-binding protein